MSRLEEPIHTKNRKAFKRRGSVTATKSEEIRTYSGVPETFHCDNTTGMGFHGGVGEALINPTFKAFADEYGFTTIIPEAKNRRGVVERPFQYIDRTFLAGMECAGLEDRSVRGDRDAVRCRGEVGDVVMVRD